MKNALALLVLFTATVCWAETEVERGPSLASLAADSTTVSGLRDDQPVVPFLDVLRNTGRVLSRPFVPKLKDLWIIAPAVAATAVVMPFDVAIHRAIVAWPDPVLFDQRFSYWGSYLGEWFVAPLIFVSMGLFGNAHERRVCLEGLEALAAVAIISKVGKLVFRLERPSFDADQKHWFSRLSADAFPGGHTMTAFATAAVLARNYPRLAPMFYGLATYVAIARVQQSTHWLSDDIAGAAVGLLLGYAAVEINERVGAF